MTIGIQTNLQGEVLAILERHYGHRNAIKCRDLAEILSADERQVQYAIEELTNNGFPVCSQCSPPYGYFMPENLQEAEAYKHQLRSRAIGNFHRYKYFKKAFQNWFYGEPQRKLL